mmetsp:Transcript_1061/g.2503  ORF Transcript_1061/g.2503 Transcript_1061/m.2503 type:complete len:137 (-) Transcript_1061:268-678(-)
MSSTASAPANKAIALQEVQETVSRLSSHKGVRAVLILNPEGDIITQSGKQDVIGNTRLLKQMLDIAGKYSASIPVNGGGATIQESKDMDSSGGSAMDDISFISVRCRKDELLIAPKNGFVLVVLQDPAEVTSSSMD